jgi:hypothetical protein
VQDPSGRQPVPISGPTCAGAILLHVGHPMHDRSD